ncbi:MAG: flippase-like domain-containing protein, partial [Anaerolineae bacterium]|nr:flippase-like domain-containing protein [Anaerolineae bacterium]
WGRRLGLGRLLGRIKILRELYESLHLYGPAALLKASAASVVFNLMLILAYYLLGLAVGIDQSLWIYFLFVPIISALLLVPSVGGFGIREGGTILLFAQVGVDEAHALALATAYDIGVLLTGLIGVIIYVIQSIQEARR